MSCLRQGPCGLDFTIDYQVISNDSPSQKTPTLKFHKVKMKKRNKGITHARKSIKDSILGKFWPY